MAADEGGVETYVEGKAALQTFKQTLNLHLGRLIQKEMMDQQRRDESSDSDHRDGDLRDGAELDAIAKSGLYTNTLQPCRAYIYLHAAF